MSLFLPHRRFLLGARAFDLDQWLVDNNGAYFDFTRVDTTFQEAVGPTAADGVGEAVGLVLSRTGWGGRTLAQVAAAAQELCLNGTFDANITGWLDRSSAPSYCAWDASGQAKFLAGATARLRQGMTVSSGRVLKYGWAVTAGTIACLIGTAEADGTYGTIGGGGVTTIERFVPTTAAGFWLSFFTGAESLLDNVTVKEVARHSALQATAGAKPSWQSAGVKGDGTDDNLLTNYFAGAAGNVLAGVITAPASITATQILGGATSGADRGYLALDTSGRLCAGVGTDTVSTIVGSTDLRGRRAFVALTFDGATVRLIVDDAVEYEGAQHGVATTAHPYRLLAQNNAGTAATFSSAYLEKVVMANAAPVPAQIAKIKAALMAA